MKKSFKLLSLVGASVALAFGTVTVMNDQNNSVASQTVEAATTYIKLPKSKGYTKSNVLKANTGKLRGSAKRALVKGSMAGMEENTFSDYDSADDKTVTVTHLTSSEKKEISKYALAVINSARRQMGKRSWSYSSRALRFADVVAKCYNQDGASISDADHDVRGIERAARICGLNSRVGQVYEDEAGLPISSEYNGNTRSMKVLKEQIYFNIKQMLFGGYYGNNVHNASAYTEWQHAGDLLGLRSKVRGADASTKLFGVSFSSLDNRLISVHMIGVAKRYILNYKKFNK